MSIVALATPETRPIIDSLGSFGPSKPARVRPG